MAQLSSLGDVIRSPLTRKIAAVVFAGVMVLEALILVPSYQKRERELLADLAIHAEEWIAGVTYSLSGTATPDEMAVAMLGSESVTGIVLVDPSGTVTRAGERISGGPFLDDPYRTRDGSRYEVPLQSAANASPYLIVVRLDSTGVGPMLWAYVQRIFWLSLLISVALTAATLLTVGTVVLAPLSRLKLALERGELKLEGRRGDGERLDEIGDLFRAAATILKELNSSRETLEANVTERTEDLRRANRQLQASERRFRDFVRASSDFYWEMDANLRYSYLSDRFTQVTGVPKVDLLGRTRDDTPALGTDRRAWNQYLRDLSEHRPFRNFVHAQPTPAGELVYLSISGQPVFDADGAFAGYRGTGSNVTVAIEAQRELEHQKTLLEVTLANIQQGVSVYDADMKLVAWNDRYAQLRDLPETLLRQRPSLRDIFAFQAARGFYARLGGDLDSQVEDMMRLATGGDLSVASEQERPDGSVHEVRSQRLPEGGLVRTFNDITERKRAEETLRQNALLMRTIFDTASIGILQQAPDGQRRLAVNKAFCEITGYSEEELLAVPFQTVTHPEDLNEAVDQRERFARGEIGGDVGESRIIRKNGEVAWVHRSLTALHDENGEVERFVSFVQDITERKRAQAEIAERERILSRVLENMQHGIMMLDEELNVEIYNQRLIDMFGIPEELLQVGQPLLPAMRFRVERGDFGEGAAEDICERREALIRGATSDLVEEGVLGNRTIETRWSLAGDGSHINVATDITERKKGERLLEQAKEEAERLARSKSDLVAMVSHEVRTPMNGVLGMARLLLDTGLNAEQRGLVDVIVESGDSLVRIVNDLLDVSKLEAGRFELETVPFIVSDTIEQCLAVMTPRAKEKGLEIGADLDPALPPVVLGDPYRLRQITLNLLSNAIRFTSEGAVTVTARLAERTGETARITVEVIDTGRGIKPEDRKRLFSPYTQAGVEVARKYGGTGLGLAVCWRLIERMGGRIAVDSTPGEGSTFSFTLPFVLDAETDAAELREAARQARVIDVSTRNGNTPSLSVLQVEDNKVNQKVVELILARAGHSVVTVGDGAAALAALETGSFDAVLMDRHMPVMNGLEATRQIRAMDGPRSALPVIGVTAGALGAELDACLDAGMNTVVTKPVDAAELCAALARLTSAAPEAATDSRPVLVIDDLQINLTVTRRQLGKLGIACDLADSGQEALMLMEQGDYAAVLVDVSMPDMDGLAFTRALRAREVDTPRRVPVIAMTGHVDREARSRFMAAGMDDYLAKPVVLEELGAMLAKWRSGGGEAALPADAPAPAPDADAPPVDMALLADIIGEDSEAEKLTWVREFDAAFPPLLRDVNDAAAKQHREATRDAAHAAKSAANSIAALPLADILQRLENESLAGEWRDINLLVAAVEKEYERVSGFPDQFSQPGT